MEVFIRNICPSASPPELKRAIASVLHDPSFAGYHTLPLNFDVSVHQPRRLGPRTGTLVLPSEEVGEHFLRECGGHWPRRELSVGDFAEPLSFEPGRYDPRPEVLHRIRTVPYVDPQREAEQLRLAQEFRSHLVHVSAVQWGWECRDNVFSVEYEKDCRGKARLGFDPEHRQFRLRIHEQDRNTVIAFRASQILWTSVATDPALQIPVIFFSLSYAPSYESELPTDIAFDDELDMFDTSRQRSHGPSRWRLDCIDEDHRRITEYTSHSLRFICEDSLSAEDFRWICRQAHIAPLREHVYPTVRREIFDSGVQEEYQQWLFTLPWEVAFQVDALARENVLDLQELLRIRPHLAALVKQHGRPWTASFLRHLSVQARDTRWYQDSAQTLHLDVVMELFAQSKASFTGADALNTLEDTFLCYHAKVTPSRVLLDGPFPERNNRVMRKYAGYTSKFLRVTFMDENGLQYRYDRDVDSHKFIKENFGAILLEGLNVAGRDFEFLAYSQSGLKQHSVWFMRPFKMPGVEGIMNVDTVIAGLGIFHGIQYDPGLMQCPARYGARLAQAFTTTEAAVEVEVEEVFNVDDIKTPDGRRCFTDGVGTMSKELAMDIWRALKEKSVRHRRYGRCMPKAIQIRFQGSKGMLSLDPLLKGRAICLRPSMKKFEAPGSMTIEVAAVFNKPAPFYLNRPLIMLSTLR